MHACMKMANMFEAQGNIADACLHRASAIRHLQTSVLGADSMFVANAHAKNGIMMRKVGVAARLHSHLSTVALQAGRLDEAQAAYTMSLRMKLAKV